MVWPTAHEASHFVDDDDLQMDALPDDFDVLATSVSSVAALFAAFIMEQHWREIVCLGRTAPQMFDFWNIRNYVF